MAEIFAFVNPKGGTGKTTACISIAGFLANSNKMVLIVDIDPQADAMGADRNHTGDGPGPILCKGSAEIMGATIRPESRGKGPDTFLGLELTIDGKEG
jgi:hypothetical protein